MKFTEQDALGFNTKIMFILQAKKYLSESEMSKTLFQKYSWIQRCIDMGQNTQQRPENKQN